VRAPRADLARLLSWYPEPWRRRYGDELAVLMEDQLDGRTPSARFRVSVALAGLRERGHQSGIVGRGSAPIERVRAGTLLVLCAWTGFAVAGASFSKLSEHFAAALPKPLRGLPQTAFGQVEIGGCRRSPARDRGAGRAPGIRPVRPLRWVGRTPASPRASGGPQRGGGGLRASVVRLGPLALGGAAQRL
jgi:hypothetical protein